jgi:hypothetical protein
MFRKKFRSVYIVLNTWSCILLFKFVLWYTLFLFCVEFKIVLYQFLYRCGHFNLSLITNQTISDSFLEMCSPVKFTHSLSKKSGRVSSWGLCIILWIKFVMKTRWTSSFLKPTALNKVHFPFSLALDRVSSQEIWQIMHNPQLLTLPLFFDSEWANFTGLHISKNESDIVWLVISDKERWCPSRLHDEFDSLDLIPTNRIQYYRSCYESYTSKINLEKIEPVEAQMNASACGLVRTSEYICVKTRSTTAPFDWSQCIFCKQKSYKKDRNLKRFKR